jgi:KDO2-lipid IV(A) lauroyltransferase
MRPDIAILYVLMRLVGRLPLKVLHGIGAAIGWVMWRSGTRGAHQVRVNIGIARPKMDSVARERLVRDAMLHLGRSVTEMAWIWGRGAHGALRAVRDVRGIELFETALAADRGLIIAAPHMGCWELLNYWLAARTPMALLYRPPHLRAFEPLLRKVRGDLAPEQVRAEGAGVRALYRRLARHGNVGILPDQKPRAGEGQVAPFFGRDALTMVLLPRLAARTGATVLYAFVERLPRGRGYRLHFVPAPEGLTDPDMARACAALNRGVERCVEQAFTQYQWHYRRFSGHGLINPYDG